MSEITELQAKYLEGVETMSEEDARRFHEILVADEKASFRAVRLMKLERHLENIEATKRASDARERRWQAEANEYKTLTNQWLALGARWRPIGTALTVWEYEGERFYQWWSRTLITDNIEEARKADAKLAEIISRKQANK
ncbi:hypothetical protein [Lederbergia citri]|uniref:Uncharacterized protein n=1 Tax=Lederbergia citri TaxID=2833580 RepID=A0A942TEK5_9BACI|nr:hypothetical protein [Lederbergia citri]MBS4195346.1 hypothetical protein [Lederbergia citri]